MSFAELRAHETAAARRWLSIVGIGEDGIEGLTPIARSLIQGAEIVFGGQRHLALAAPLIRGASRPWRSPFEGAIEDVLAQRGRDVCVLASGDPFVYGVGSLLLRHIDPRETVAVPAPSTFSLAAARLGWVLPETIQLSLHGRSLDLVRPHLQPGARVLALTSDGEGPAALARLLAGSGFGRSRLTVLEALGGARERIRRTTATAFDLGDVDPLNAVALEVEGELHAVAHPVGRRGGDRDARLHLALVVEDRGREGRLERELHAHVALVLLDRRLSAARLDQDAPPVLAIGGAGRHGDHHADDLALSGLEHEAAREDAQIRDE